MYTFSVKFMFVFVSSVLYILWIMLALNIFILYLYMIFLCIDGAV